MSENELNFLLPDEELQHFKTVVRALMDQAGAILADLAAQAEAFDAVDKIDQLDHCLDYTKRLCE
jgi:hypothetical protein